MGRRWVACIALSACSWTLTEKIATDYDPHSASSPPRCDAGRGPVVADMIFMAISAVSASVELNDSRENVKNAGFADLAVGLVYALSAASGISWTNSCRDAFTIYDQHPQPSAPTESPEAAELRQLRAEKAARDAAELKRLRAEHNALTDAGVSVDAATPSDGATD